MAIASAADAPAKSTDPFSGYELRIAGLAHNIEPGGDEHGGLDLGGSILLPKAATGFGPSSSLWVPRIHIGGTGNFEGKTSFVYAGVTWSVPVAQNYFFSVDFGGALNNGEPQGVQNERVAIGCHATFREAAALGRSVTENMSVAATIEHFSNADLCDRNSGVTNIGLMVSYKF
jgi:hypothetical protein